MTLNGDEMLDAMSTRAMPEVLRVAVIYRVLQTYRMPLFKRLAQLPDIELKVFHGPSFRGTKVVNGPNDGEVPAQRLRSLQLRLRTRHGHAVAPFSPGLYAALDRFKPHVILCEGASNLPNNLIAYLYGLKRHAPLVQWGLGAIKGRKPSLLRKMVQPIIAAFERRAEITIAYSQRSARYYERIGIPPDRIVVATNVVDTQRRLQEIASLDRESLYVDAHRESDFVVLFVGTLTPVKRVDMLVDAFARIADEPDHGGKTPRLWVVGDGPSREALEERSAHLGERVQFFGRVTKGVSRYFLSADVFVLPGLGGLAVSDAMVHGLPVIASIGDGTEADLLTPEAGILDEELSVDRLAGHLRKLREDPTFRARLGAEAVRRIRDGANIESCVESIRAAVHRAYAERRKTS